jgi:Flp pilus assembly protein TadG
MKRRSGNREKGSAVAESALVLAPLLLAILAACDLSRAMWTYHTLCTAVKTATRFAVVHGARCQDASSSCPVSVAQVVSSLESAATGLDPSCLQMTLNSGQSTLSCGPAGNCTSDQDMWPVSPSNAVGQPLTIMATYSFQPVLASLLPGGTVNLMAQSTEIIEF